MTRQPVWVVVIRGNVMGVYASRRKAEDAVFAHPASFWTAHIHGPMEVQ